MADTNPSRDRMPAWGVAITIIAALMLLGVVIVVLANRPGPERRASALQGECDLLAKVVSCTPSSPLVEYVSATTYAR